LDEVMSLSDRIAVLFRGQIAGEMHAGEATEEELGILMAGGSLLEGADGRDAPAHPEKGQVA
jgi:simple sugar transport system ATP-binding protein